MDSFSKCDPQYHSPHTHPLVNFTMLELNKSSTYGSNIALLIGEGHSPCPLGIFQLGVCVYPCITHSSVKAVHDHSQLHCKTYTHGGIICTLFYKHTRVISPTPLIFRQICSYLLSVAWELHRQIWSSLGLTAVTRPSQNRNH